MAKKKSASKNTETDLRKLPKDKRPKPTSGQSAEKRAVPWEDLNEDEGYIVELLAEDKKRQPRSIEWMAEAFEDVDDYEYNYAKLRVRNALRRLVQGDWVERIDRGVYQLTEKAKKRYRRASAA